MKDPSPFSALANKSLKMIEIEGGSFRMGSNRNDREKPIHLVELSSFCLGTYPVSQALWEEVMGENPSRFKGPELPVEYVSWDDCLKFLKLLNGRLDLEDSKAYRLPSEAEWEYAARGGRSTHRTEYAGSGLLKEVGWFWDTKLGKHSHGETQTPGFRIPNELGLYDLSGNVWEWCADWYGKYPDRALKNPKGPASGSSRVLRGGSWIGNADGCRVAYRNDARPDFRYGIFGLRLARTVL